MHFTAATTNLELVMGIGDIVGIALTVSRVFLTPANGYLPVGLAFNSQIVMLLSVITTLDYMEQYGNYGLMGFSMLGLNQEQSWQGRIGIH